MLTIIICSLLCLAMASCNEETGKPASSNRPYQVLLVGDSDGILYHELNETAEGLPQPEPRFDITTANEEQGSDAPWQKLYRSIVHVVIDRRAKDTHMTLRRDIYAQPQVIITITAPSVESLRDYIAARRGSVCRILEAFENGCQKRNLEAHHNEKFNALIRRKFGIDILIPADMLSSKQGKDFLWLSNNQNEGLQNICIYRVKDGRHTFKEVRDSVMRINIPGEKDGMYMETAALLPAVRISKGDSKADGKTTGQQTASDRQRQGHVLYRGLWDMKDDAMGGPFVAIEMKEPPYIIYIEGFVYAPESKKRNKVRQLEAVLYTAKPVKQNN